MKGENQGAAAKGNVSDDEQNAPDSSTPTGDQADQDQQEIMKKVNSGEESSPKGVSTKGSPDPMAENLPQEENRQFKKHMEELGKNLEHLKLLRLDEGIHGSSLLSASTRPRDEHETVKEEHSTPKPPHAFPTTKLSDRTGLDLGQSPATTCTDVSRIPVNTEQDKRQCFITGMVAISGTQLTLADATNMCIKLLDLEREAVIGVKGLPSAPHDVTCVPGSRVAVTIPAFQQIYFFTADQNLEQCGDISVDGICLGIHYSGDKLFVSCKHPPLVQILKMDGDIIKTIKLAPVVYPKYLTCSPDTKLIYVSDFNKDAVILMDIAECERWVYSREYRRSVALTTPQGVCTGDNCIYICSFQEIYVVSPVGINLAVIPLSQTGARNAAVCYSSQDRTLYVSAFSSDPEQNAYVSRIGMR